MNLRMRDSFIFYRSFYEAIKDLPRDIQGEVYTAIMEYSLNGITTENLKPIARSIFILIRPQIDANNTKRNNGLSGGAPLGNSNNPNGRRGNKPTENQPITNRKPTNIQPNVECIMDNVNGKLEIDNENLSFNRFWNLYDKKRGDKTKLKAKFESLSKIDKKTIFDTLPTYLTATPDKQYRKDPQTYLNNKSWNDEIIIGNGGKQPQPPDEPKFTITLNSHGGRI